MSELEKLRNEITRLQTEIKAIREKLPNGGINSPRPYQNALIFLALTLALKAKTIVELGTGSGISADAFLTGLRITNGVLYSIDLYPEQEPVKSTIERLKNDPQFFFIHSDSVEATKTWKAKIDILYVDSDHGYEHVLEELTQWGKFKPQVTFVHDILGPDDNKGPPYFACEKYAEKAGVTFYPMTGFPCGLGVIIHD